ncbi:unnamed protein product, partial [Clonostachys rosea f. rosea IK726]
IIDDRATETPGRVFCEILEDNWQNTGPRKITYGEIARAVVLIEPRGLTDSGLLSLLEHTKCRHWLGGSSSYTELKKDVLETRSEMAFSTLPPLSYFLQDEKVQDYPFVATWDEIKANPVFVIHSSGTTGDPRPLSYSLEISTVGAFSRRLPDGSEENPELMFTGIHGTRVLWVAPPTMAWWYHGFPTHPGIR